MKKFCIVENKNSYYWYFSRNSYEMSLLAELLIKDIRDNVGQMKDWLLNAHLKYGGGDSCKLIKINNTIILFQKISYGEEGYNDPDFIPKFHVDIATENLIKIVDQWNELYKRRANKIIISQEDDGQIEITELTAESEYFNLPQQEPPEEPKVFANAETKFAIMGFDDDYFWHGGYNDESLFLLVDFLNDTYGNYELEVKNERIAELKQFLLSRSYKVLVAEHYILAKYDDKVILHEEIRKMYDYTKPETFPDRRFETSLENMIKIIDEWSDFVKSASKAKIMFIQKDNEPVELKLIID